MTRGWKLSVIQKLAENKTNGTSPGTMRELEVKLGLEKAGLGKTFKTSGFRPDEKEQTASIHVDRICEILAIAPPFGEADEPKQLVGAVQPDQREVLAFVQELAREIKRLPDEYRGNLQRLVIDFLARAQ